MAPKSPSKIQSNGIGRLLRQQAALTQFGSYAFREPILFNILTEAAHACAESLGVPYCKICRYRAEENDLLIEAGFGWKDGIIGEVVSEANESSPQGRAYVTGKPVIIEDIRTAKHFKLHALYAEHGIVSTIDVIIKGKEGESYGVLEIDSSVQHVYDEHDVTFLTGFANVLAEAVATHNRNEILHGSIEKMAKLIEPEFAVHRHTDGERLDPQGVEVHFESSCDLGACVQDCDQRGQIVPI